MSHSMKAINSAARRTKRDILLLLGSLLILIFTGVGAPPAQALTYAYVGPAWSVTQCQSSFSFSAPPLCRRFHHGIFHTYRYRLRLFRDRT